MRRVGFFHVVALALFLGEFGSCFGIVTRHDVDDSAFAAYGELFQSTCMIRRDGSTIGSGVLITPGFVLTAAHVVQQFDGSGLTVRLSDGRTVGIDQTLIHPSYVFGSTYDIAIIRMMCGIRGVDPTPARAAFLGPGADVTLAGYGMTGDGFSGPVEWGAGMSPWAATNRVDSILSAGTELVIDLDSPDSGSATLLEGIGAAGDSGGPLFVSTDSGWQVCGLISRGDPVVRYGSLMIATHVAPHLQTFIGPAMASLGEPPPCIPAPSALALVIVGIAGVGRCRFPARPRRHRCSRPPRSPPSGTGN